MLNCANCPNWKLLCTIIPCREMNELLSDLDIDLTKEAEGELLK